MIIKNINDNFFYLQELSFEVQLVLNEGNALCRRLKSPYSFSMVDSLADGLESTVSVHDRNRHLVMHWPVEKMKQKLEVLREAAEDSGHFPFEAIFERGDVWHPEDQRLNLLPPTIRAKLDQIQRRKDLSQATLDDSHFSFNTSSRRSSILPRSPLLSSTSTTIDACKELISKISSADHLRTFVSASIALRNLLSCPDRSPRFAVLLTGHTVSLLSVFPGLIQQMIGGKEIPTEIQSSWLTAVKEHSQKLQNSVEFIMQVNNALYFLIQIR